MSSILSDAPLGKKVTYASHYQPELLFAIPRQLQRQTISIGQELPFYGYDVWNAYEVSWLNTKGKPIAAIAEFYLAIETPNLVESKSIKLYLNSLNNTKFDSLAMVEQIIQRDLSNYAGAEIIVKLQEISSLQPRLLDGLNGICLDDLDIACTTYETNPELLTIEAQQVTETVHSNLLRANCLITNQPDWASIEIAYQGNKINHENLLRYIVSFRNHNEFHEPCIERIFVDIMRRCKPQQLTVRGYFTRRGGLDINPVRSTNKNITMTNRRFIRQ